MSFIQRIVAVVAITGLVCLVQAFGPSVNRCWGDAPKSGENKEEAEENRFIGSAALQGKYVFASTETGLFRADRDKKEWILLQGKSAPEPGGVFVTAGPEDKILFYFLTPVGWRETVRAVWQPQRDDKPKQIRRPGLYRSRNAGDSWERVDDGHDFVDMLRLPGGRMFARAARKGHEKDLVLLSEDEGATWKDITNGVCENDSFFVLMRDPDHAQRVCLYAPFTIRSGGTIYEAEDDRFHWKERYSGLDAEQWPPDARKSEEKFFEGYYSYPGYSIGWTQGTVKNLPEEMPGQEWDKNNVGIGTVGVFQARLDNYFTHPFRDRVSIASYDVVPEKAAYEFRLKEPMPVRASLVSYKESPCPRLLDSPDSTRFWSLKGIGPDGEKKAPKLGNDPLGHLKDDNKTLKQSLLETKLAVFLLTPAKPHSHTIDLRDLGTFDKPGRYKVQFTYNSGWWRDNQKVMRYMDPVAGQVFSVTITP